MGKWGLSVGESARLMGLSKATVRRWFDEDIHVADRRSGERSGRLDDKGRTGTGERRVNPSWAQFYADHPQVRGERMAGRRRPARPNPPGG